MITLFDYKMAPSPRRTRILMAEKRISHKRIQIDLRNGEQLSTAYRMINPDCTVPALRIDDDNVLTDNAAIAAWAEAAYPEPPLLGRSALEKAQIASWNAKIEQMGMMAVAEALRNSNPAMKDRALPGPDDYPQIPELAQRGMARLHNFLDMFNTHMQGRIFVATEEFTIADISAVVTIDFAKVVGIEPASNHVHITAWHEHMKLRPSYTA